MKILLAGILAAVLLLAVMAGCGKSSGSPIVPVNSMVQVWRTQVRPEAFGIIVGDGSQVLTVVDYELYNPGDMKVSIPGLGYYNATFEATDSRTGATLLKLQGIKRTPASTGDTSTLTDGEKLLINGWTGSSDSAFKTTPVSVTGSPQGQPPLSFEVHLPQGIEGPGSVPHQGAIVADEEGKVFGLESIFNYELVTRIGSPGYIPPIISINSALEMLSPDYSRQPWANGPLLFSVTGRYGLSGNYDGLVKNYTGIADAIQILITQLGNPVPVEDIYQNYLGYISPNGSQDGTLLTTVFPRPVELRDEQGNALALAKWIGIQWGRDNGNANRLIWGTSAYNVSGAFELKGDITNLQNILITLVGNPYGT